MYSFVANFYANFVFIEELYMNSLLWFYLANLMCVGCKLKESWLSVCCGVYNLGIKSLFSFISSFQHMLMYRGCQWFLWLNIKHHMFRLCFHILLSHINFHLLDSVHTGDTFSSFPIPIRINCPKVYCFAIWWPEFLISTKQLKLWSYGKIWTSVKDQWHY